MVTHFTNGIQIILGNEPFNHQHVPVPKRKSNNIDLKFMKFQKCPEYNYYYHFASLHCFVTCNINSFPFKCQISNFLFEYAMIRVWHFLGHFLTCTWDSNIICDFLEFISIANTIFNTMCESLYTAIWIRHCIKGE